MSGKAWLTLTRVSGGPIRPHMTLAHGLELDIEAFTAVLRERLETYAAFNLTFTGLGMFTGPGILHLTTRMTETLWTLHREVADLAEAQGEARVPSTAPTSGRLTVL